MSMRFYVPHSVVAPCLLLLACHESGGSSEAQLEPHVPQRVAFDLGKDPMCPSQLVSAQAPSPILIADQLYEITFSEQSGAAVATSIGMAISPSLLSVALPTLLSPGSYEGDFLLNDKGDTGRLSLTVVSGPTVTDPVSYFADFMAALGASLNAMEVDLQAEQNPALRFAREQDLARGNHALATLQGWALAADADEVRKLSLFLEANQLLGRSAPGDQGTEVDPRQVLIEIERSVATAREQLKRGVTLMAGSTVVERNGIPMTGIAIGALGLVTAYDGIKSMEAGVFSRAIKPVGGLHLSHAAGLLPVDLPFFALTVFRFEPLPVVARAKLSTVSESLRGDPALARTFFLLDQIYSAHAELSNGVRQLMLLPPPRVPSSVTLSTRTLPLQDVSITAQSNRFVTLVLEDGLVIAETNSLVDEETRVTLHYDGAPLWRLQSEILVTVTQGIR